MKKYLNLKDILFLILIISLFSVAIGVRKGGGTYGVGNTFKYPITIGENGSSGGSLSLKGATSGMATINVNAVAGSTTFQLPTTNGTNGYVLSTNGSGITSWITPPSSMTYPSGSGIPLVVSGASWGTTITNNSTNWNTAFGWGNHALIGYALRDDVRDSILVAMAATLDTSEFVIALIDSCGLNDIGAGTYASGYDYMREGVNPITFIKNHLGATRKAETTLSYGSSLTLSDGLAYYTLIYIPQATTITGVMIGMSTQGSYTSDNFNGVALYSISGGTFTRVAISTDDGDIWKASSGTLITKAFSSTYAATAGVYAVGILFNSNGTPTTAPVIVAEASAPSIRDATLPSSYRIHSYRSAQTTLPTSEVTTNLSAAFYIPCLTLY